MPDRFIIKGFEEFLRLGMRRYFILETVHKEYWASDMWNIINIPKIIRNHAIKHTPNKMLSNCSNRCKSCYQKQSPNFPISSQNCSRSTTQRRSQCQNLLLFKTNFVNKEIVDDKCIILDLLFVWFSLVYAIAWVFN